MKRILTVLGSVLVAAAGGRLGPDALPDGSRSASSMRTACRKRPTRASGSPRSSRRCGRRKKASSRRRTKRSRTCSAQLESQNLSLSPEEGAAARRRTSSGRALELQQAQEGRAERVPDRGQRGAEQVPGAADPRHQPVRPRRGVHARDREVHGRRGLRRGVDRRHDGDRRQVQRDGEAPGRLPAAPPRSRPRGSSGIDPR